MKLFGIRTTYEDRSTMKRQEFIDKLRAALSGRVSESLINENVRYYENYIAVEIRNGQSEEEVIASLGDPRLLARTIIEANKQAGPAEFRESSEAESESVFTRRFKMPGWLVAFLITAVVLLLISTVFSVIFKLLPILIPILVIVLLVKMIRYYS